VDCSPLGGSLAVGGILGAGTAVVGGLVGLLVQSDRWEQVPTGRARVAVVPLRGRGVGVGVSIAF